MSKIDIGIYMKNVKYARALARGLCNESTNLNIFFADKENDVEKLITEGLVITDYDMPNNPKIMFLREFAEESEVYEGPSKISPVRAVLSKLSEMAYSNYGMEWEHTHGDEAKIISLISQEGGVGVTSIAIGMARMLSLKECSVIYINMGPLDDYERYAEAEFEGTKCKMQYMLYKDQGMKGNIKKFLGRDEWGVYYFKPEKIKNSLFDQQEQDKILKYLTNENFFTHIIVDYGKGVRLERKKNEKLVAVYKKNCYRVLSKAHVESDLNIINFMDYLEDEEGEICINCDPDSFVNTAQNIEISMSGNFMDQIEKIINAKESLFI